MEHELHISYMYVLKNTNNILLIFYLYILDRTVCYLFYMLPILFSFLLFSNLDAAHAELRRVAEGEGIFPRGRRLV